MNKLETNEIKLIWTKSYKSHWYALNVVTYPFTIRNWKTDFGVDKGFYHLYFGDNYVDKFDTLQKAKNYAEGINNKQEVA